MEQKFSDKNSTVKTKGQNYFNIMINLEINMISLIIRDC